MAPLTDRGDQSGALAVVTLGSNCIKGGDIEWAVPMIV
jgi:hypothetical protein